jgi:hypothetical protein
MLIPARSIEKLKPTWRPRRRSTTPLAFESCAAVLPPRDRQAGADGRIDARDVARSMKVRRGADQISCRDTNQRSRSDAADGERKLLPAEAQGAAAAGHAKDETRAGDVQGDLSSRGLGRRDEGCGRETGAR